MPQRDDCCSRTAVRQLHAVQAYLVGMHLKRLGYVCITHSLSTLGRRKATWYGVTSAVNKSIIPIQQSHSLTCKHDPGISTCAQWMVDCPCADSDVWCCHRTQFAKGLRTCLLVGRKAGRVPRSVRSSASSARCRWRSCCGRRLSSPAVAWIMRSLPAASRCGSCCHCCELPNGLHLQSLMAYIVSLSVMPRLQHRILAL